MLLINIVWLFIINDVKFLFPNSQFKYFKACTIKEPQFYLLHY